jgi:chromosome segregation ATPase
MLKRVVIAVSTLVLVSGCATNGQDQVATGDVSGLNAKNTNIISYHNSEKSNVMKTKTGQLQARGLYEQAESEIFLLQSKVKELIADRNAISAKLLEENTISNDQLIALNRMVSSIQLKKAELNKSIEKSNAQLESIEKAIRALDDESAITGEDIPWNTALPLAPTMPNQTAETKKVWLDNITPEVQTIQRLQSEILLQKSVIDPLK